MKAKVKATIVVIMDADVDINDDSVQDVNDILDIQDIVESEVIEYLG